MPSVELREVEIFLVLAQELHFGHTAERLYLTQSRVSQAIRALEAQVGGRLFDRTTRRVQLTPVGEKLRDQLGPPYAELLQAFEAARDLMVGVVGELRISATTLTALGSSFAQIQSTFRERHPGCPVTLREDRTLDALVALRRGECDIAVAWLPLTQPDLTIGPVLTHEERVLLVGVGHPLSRKDHATVEDLGDCAVLRFEEVFPPETCEAFCPRYTPSGRPIERTHRIRGAFGLLAAVAAGEIVHPTMTSVPEHYRHPEVTSMPLLGLPAMESALVWVTARETAAIRAFAQVASEIRSP